MKKRFLLILLISFLFSSGDHWSTTRFEYWWNSNFNSMQFREPIIFIPYNIKIGKFYYGGEGYISDAINEGIIDTLEVSPYFTDNQQNFNYIDNNLKYREGIFIDIDFLSYNFFNKIQNNYDIHFGFNYKLNKILEKPFVDSNWIDGNIKTIYARPTIQSLGLNLGLINQWHPLFFNKITYTHGLVEANMFEASGGSRLIYGVGDLKSLSFEIIFIKSLKAKKYDLHYGTQLTFEEIDINQIDNMDAHIEKFKSQSVKISFSIGIGYGGKQTIGDIGYSNLISNNYIDAIENFEQFKLKNVNHSKQELVQEMIDFSNTRIGYEILYNGINSHRSGNLHDAFDWYVEASKYADYDLSREINFRKYLLADELLNNINDDLSINEAIDELENIKLLSDKIIYKANERIAELLYRKGESLLIDNFYESSYNILVEAKNIYPEKEYIFNGKINLLISELIKDTQDFIKNKEYILAYSTMHLLDQIYIDNQVSFDGELLELKEKIIASKKQRILTSSKKIINQLKAGFDKSDNMEYLVEGDNYNKIISIFGAPADLVEKYIGQDQYRMITYKGLNNEFKFYFKNNQLIDIEEII